MRDRTTANAKKVMSAMIKSRQRGENGIPAPLGLSLQSHADIRLGPQN